MADLRFALVALALGAALVLLGLLIAGIAQLVAHRSPASPAVEFVPPAGDVVTHGLAVRADRHVLTAALLDLAVRGRVRVLGTPGRRGPVAIEALPGASFSPDERFLLQAFRPDRMRPRQQRRYLRALREIGVAADRLEDAPDVFFLRGRGAFRSHRRRSLTRFLDATRSRMSREGLTRRRAGSAHLVLLSLLFLATVLAGVILLIGAAVNGDPWGALAVLVNIAAVFWVLTLAPPPLLRFTAHGEDLRRRLSGLRDYMRLAEQDRLRMLQSPAGALRTPAGALTPGGQALGLRPQPTAGDPVAQSELDRFVLIERLLPYAVVFRQERAWQRELEHLGGGTAAVQNMRTLGHTLDGVMTVLEALAIVGQIARAIGGVLSLVVRIGD